MYFNTRMELTGHLWQGRFRSCPTCLHARTVAWPGKQVLTFSDALTAVRRYLWSRWLFESLFPRQPLQKLPRVREFLLHALVPAA